MKNTGIDILKKILECNNIEYNDDIKYKLDIYFNMLIEYNEMFNLTAITDYDEVYIKHYADSAINCAYYKYNASLCDIGTGAGFPGLLLKIIRPDLNITLVDSLNKRISFLEKVIDKLKLTNVQCLHYRAEDIDFKTKYLNSFDYVVARAVAQMPTLVEYCLPYVKVGGQFIAYKGNNITEELSLANKSINILGGSLNSVLRFELVPDTERNLIIINKIKASDIKYPRNQNKPRLKPLI